MNDNSQISIDSSGLARVSGPLTLETVTAVYQQAGAEAAKGQAIAEIDLDAVSRVDSSGLALLLEWQSAAKINGRSLHIRNAPADLLSLVSLCEASDLLTIEGRNPPANMAGAPDHSLQDASL